MGFALLQAVRTGIGGVLAALTVASCAQSVAVDDSAVAATADQLDSVYVRILGKAAQRRAGTLIQYHQIRDTMKSCMRTNGFDYQPPPFTDAYAGATDARLGVTGSGSGTFNRLSTSGWALGKSDLPLAAAADETLHANSGFTSLSEANKARYSEAALACRPAVQLPEFPDGALDLSASLEQMLAEVESDSRVRPLAKEYLSCMAAAGYRLENPNDLVRELIGEYGKARPAAPINGRTSGSAWNAVAAREARTASDDVQCRRNLYGTDMMLVAEPLADWETKHAADLAAVQLRWQAVVFDAEKYPEW